MLVGTISADHYTDYATIRDQFRTAETDMRRHIYCTSFSEGPIGHQQGISFGM